MSKGSVASTSAASQPLTLADVVIEAHRGNSITRLSGLDVIRAVEFARAMFGHGDDWAGRLADRDISVPLHTTISALEQVIEEADGSVNAVVATALRVVYAQWHAGLLADSAETTRRYRIVTRTPKAV